MATFQNIKVELSQKLDRNKNPFYNGRLQAPTTLNFQKGVVFFAFTSDATNEALDIGCARPGSACSGIKRLLDQNGDLEGYSVDLEPKVDQDGNTYYMAIVQDGNLKLNLEDGYVFFVWTTPDAETLQIKKNKFPYVARGKSVQEDTEVSYRRDPSGEGPRRAGAYAG